MNYELLHYGTKRFSGRYEWGSGENPYQHEPWYPFLRDYTDAQEPGKSKTEIAKQFNMTRRDLEGKVAASLELANSFTRSRILRLKEHGYKNTTIAEKLGITEGTVRNTLKKIDNDRQTLAMSTAEMLKKEIENKKYIDVSKGVNNELNISEGKLNAALNILKEQGYHISTIKVPQTTDKTGEHNTTTLVLSKEEVTPYFLYNNLDKIQPIQNYSSDGGSTFHAWQYPESLDSKRIKIRYGDEGGREMDGVIQLRKGVEDLSLGGKAYAQVRILVDDSHYLKGMAIYADDMPKGVDVIFNTNKGKNTPMLGEKDNTILKPIKKNNDENPFGATLKPDGQSYYKDKNGKFIIDAGQYVLATSKTPENVQRYSLSKINRLRDEGDWNEYQKSLPSQFLSKQPKKLIQSQLNLDYANKVEMFNEYNSITVPAIRKHLLENFAGNCDKAASELKAAALPRQASKVLLPVPSLKAGEIFAPTYKNGEKVALIRYPHQGIYEIPILTVNNNNKEGRSIVRLDSVDAVGINFDTATQLSGADFDGDHVTIIPLSTKVKIVNEKPKKELLNFDPKLAYPGYPGMKKMTSQQKGMQMGLVTNLITDMSLQKADESEIIRATKHAMVVIDAEKHGLNWRQSEEDFGIQALKKKYQSNSKSGRGAATLISQASSEAYEPAYWRTSIDPKTGEIIKYPSGKTKTYYQRDKKTKEIIKNPDGSPKLITKQVQVKTTKMAKVKDAFELSSGTVQEKYYAEYANQMKALANKARKELVTIKPTPVSPSLKKEYAFEIDSIKNKVSNAELNAPRERYANRLANTRFKDWKEKQDWDTIKKEGGRKRDQLLAQARVEVGASSKNRKVKLTDQEWDAIKSGAVSNQLINKVIKNIKDEDLIEYLYPQDSRTISDAQINRMKAMSSVYTLQEIADELNISVSTVSKYLREAG